MKETIFFTDGATPNNHNKGHRNGGVGVFFGDDDPRNISFGMVETEYQKVTNQVCELMACIRGIEKLISTEKIMGKQIVIYTDSMYIVNTIANWATGWEKNGWKRDTGKIANLDLIKKLYFYSRNLGVIYRHVSAHEKEPEDKTSDEWKLWYGNYMADKLAVEGAKKVSKK
jgi:ribonuclease HI